MHTKSLCFGAVLFTAIHDARVLEMPEAVSIVTGNQTARAMSPAAEKMAEGETTMANGIHAVAGIGPTTLSTGIPQYRTGEDQPIQTPLTKPAITPIAYPLISRMSECHVLSS